MKPSAALVATGAMGLLLFAVFSSHSGHASAHRPAASAPRAQQARQQLLYLRDGRPLLATQRVSLDQEIARLGRQVPARAEYAREAYRQAGDLYQFMSEQLQEAESGERASEFYVYLALGRCQTYLRLDAEAARALNDRMMLELADGASEERRLWSSEYERCRGFSGGDLSELKAAMGEELPGAEAEYASIWYQRAADAGYPPALAEGALRISMLSEGERVGMLEEAVASGDPEVYWQLYFHSPAADDAVIAPAGMAWLIDACRAGYDCSSRAEWFRDIACQQENEHCAPDESAIGHYWSHLSVPEREQAWRLAGRIVQDRAAGRFDAMPWPSLSRRNVLARRAAEALDNN